MRKHDAIWWVQRSIVPPFQHHYDSYWNNTLCPIFHSTVYSLVNDWSNAHYPQEETLVHILALTLQGARTLSHRASSTFDTRKGGGTDSLDNSVL